MSTDVMRKLICLLGVIGVAAAFAERQPFERYQGIVDRQMFGPLPSDFDPTKMPSEVVKAKSKAGQELTKEQEQVKKAIRFSVMNVSAAGETFVGFTDSADPKLPVHYYLKEGESQNGWTVKEADAESSSMTIVNKDGVEVTLKLGGDSASNAAAVSRQNPTVEPESKSRSSRSSGLMYGSVQRNRRERREREARYEEDAARFAEREKARAEREAQEKLQREAEREEHRQELQSIQDELRKLKAVNSTRSVKEAEKPADDEQ